MLQKELYAVARRGGRAGWQVGPTPVGRQRERVVEETRREAMAACSRLGMAVSWKVTDGGRTVASGTVEPGELDEVGR